eukprot:CAMPEP_0172719972 /NCGR_PEP_ID=MMETSP1074-20121228/75869_1 /TAXON_ID=2916 /ORGANISM="Ceratium fusus, Strain PA161109" /LENGTH=160 /DNA_ID=CAMNT_0013545395 /DNA_START=41 /DNA_END=520 /DNA_ORIENTATION=-
MMRALAVSALVATVAAWEPEACSELPDGVPCRKLYEHPQGSQFVTPCPVDSHTSPEGCAAQFAGKSEEQKCSQITCPKALGKTMKLVCSGQCCPVCWAPDHVIGMDRHTALSGYDAVVPAAPQAPTTCGGGSASSSSALTDSLKAMYLVRAAILALLAER